MPDRSSGVPHDMLVERILSKHYGRRLRGMRQSLNMSDHDLLATQKLILENQTTILANQGVIQQNQQVIEKNQQALDRIQKNQELILANQAKIIALLGK
jgi:hypothetical protein